MRLLLLCSLFLAPSAAADPVPGEVEAIMPDGSLWDYIEASTGVPPTEEDVKASAELAEERFAEQGLIGRAPDNALYTDPLAATSDDPLHVAAIDAAEFDIPVTYNDSVGKWMRYFLGKGRKYYHKWLGRSTHWRPMMYAELERQEMPRDLVYLSMIESGYASHARSYASAVGLWQFMSATGREYGLRVDYWADERRDPVKSTRSGVAYLKELHRQFDDWYLAWAAYNGGPGRVGRAIRSTGSKDFWVIAKSGQLHSETNNYVPKLLAAAIIGKHPERYGFTGIEYQDEFTWEAVTVDGSVSLDVLAECADTDVETIKSMNPALLRDATPPDKKTTVYVPKGTGESFAVAFAAVPADQRVSYRRHRVAKGESLGKIAGHYGVSVSDLTKFNRISNPNRIYVGMELIIPVAGATPPPALAAAAPSAPSASVPAPKAATSTTHRVSKGDTLSGIATRYGVSTADLRSWNNLKDANHVMVGQSLMIRGGKPAAQVSTSYTVARGDNLTKIAERHGVTVKQLQDWNNIKNSSSIRVGQTLKLHTATSSWTNYTVKAGDSLGGIARHYGCSVSDLKSWNNLSTSVIQPGQKLRVQRG